MIGYFPTLVSIPPTFSPKEKHRGRPSKNIDVGIIFHMIFNGAEITKVALHLGVHRDTIYSNFAHVIKEAGEAHRKAWRIIMDEWFRNFLEAKRLKEEAKLSKRKYKRRMYRYR